jgi:GWxTD domain-containing protein
MSAVVPVRAIAIGAVSMLLAVAAAGEGTTAAAAIRFAADAASFPDSLGRVETHLYVSVPLTSIPFTPDGAGGGLADLDVSATWTDRKGHRLAGADWSYRRIPGSQRSEENEGRSLQRRYLFRLPAGDARVKVRVAVPGTKLSGEAELEVKVPSFSGSPLKVSDLAFGVCGDLVVAAPPENFEGGVLPHPSRTYGDDVPVICVYALAADSLAGLPDTAYALRWEIHDGGGRTVRDSTLAFPRREGRGAIVLRPGIAGLTMGTYRLTVDVSVGSSRVRREGTFRIDESRISVLRDPQMVRTVLGYVATNDEMIALENAPDDSLESIWTRFWVRRDPSPETSANEALIEFMQRVEYATRNFGVLEPGWHSDMGRIYIKYGPPEQVDRTVSNVSGIPTEIWTYYGRNATFVFQDQDGFGRYRLVGTRRN